MPLSEPIAFRAADLAALDAIVLGDASGNPKRSVIVSPHLEGPVLYLGVPSVGTTELPPPRHRSLLLS